MLFADRWIDRITATLELSPWSLRAHWQSVCHTALSLKHDPMKEHMKHRQLSSNEPIRALLCARSTNEPHLGPSTAVARQWSALRTFVENQDWICQREYSDEEMIGLTRDRAALREVLDACRAGPTNLVVVTDFVTHQPKHATLVRTDR